MSGPKSSDYYLSEEQLAWLEEQHRIRRLKKKIKLISAKCAFSEPEIEQFRTNAAELMNEYGSENGIYELDKEFGTAISAIKDTIEGAKKLHDSSSLSESYNKLKKLKNKKDKLLVQMHKADSDNTAQLNGISNVRLDEKIDSDFSVIKSRSERELKEIIGTINAKLGELHLMENPSDSLKNEISAAKTHFT